MSILPIVGPPKSPLARYRLLAPTAAVRVSPLCLGTMNFGSRWSHVMGHCDQSSAEAILDYYYEQGGNFIDTSNNYQFGESEMWVGEWMKKREIRDQIVLATKYTTNYRAGNSNEGEILANFGGNGAKSLFLSVYNSLKRLQTDYIDILYVHWWDYTTGVPELMQSLNQLVLQGKILYLGVSDTPAWIVAKANEYARNHGLRQFSVYQGRWSGAARDFERDIIPMTREDGMGLVPFGVLGSGAFKTEEQRKAATSGRKMTATEDQIRISRELETIARSKGGSPDLITSVALAYVLHKAPYVFPVVGLRKVEHLKQNIQALTLRLTNEDIERIERAVPFDLGFPHDLLWNAAENGGRVPDNPADVWLSRMSGNMDYVQIPKAIAPPVRPKSSSSKGEQ